MSAYSPLFIDYLNCALCESLRQVNAAALLVPEQVRRQAWHLLSFAFNDEIANVVDDQIWHNTRSLVLALAAKMEQAGFREEWIAYLVEAHRHSHARGDQWMAAECELQIGLLYRLMSRFDEAQRWTTASVDHFAALGDSLGERRALNELAWLEQLQHKYIEATCHVERALELANEDDIERGMSWRVQGMIAHSQRKWQEAQMYQERALAIFKFWNDSRKIAWTLQNLATAFYGSSEFEKAIVLYNQAIKTLEKYADSYHNAIIEMNLGIAHHWIGESAVGLPYLAKAATTFYHLSDTLNIARVETNLGLCHHALHNYQAAQQSFLVAIASYNILGDVAWRLNAVAGLGMSYVANQQYNKAIEILEQGLCEIDQISWHPYYNSILNYLQQYLTEARKGQR